MKLMATAVAFVLILAGCDKVSAVSKPAPEFELRDFVITEEKKDATEYVKAYNSFKGTGTLVARNVGSDRNLLVWLEAHDKTAGQNSEPQLAVVLLRGGIGKVEVSKSEFERVSARPDYRWSVLGWQELNKATINVPSAQ